MNNILEYAPETEKWTQIASMREARWAPAVSVVDFKDFADFCGGSNFTLDQHLAKLKKQYFKSKILGEIMPMKECLLRRSKENITDINSISACVFHPGMKDPGKTQEKLGFKLTLIGKPESKLF